MNSVQSPMTGIPGSELTEHAASAWSGFVAGVKDL